MLGGTGSTWGFSLLVLPKRRSLSALVLIAVIKLIGSRQESRLSVTL